MYRYFFVLGEHKELSLAEVKSLLQNQGVRFEIINAPGSVLIIDTHEPLSFAFKGEERQWAFFLMRQLGGVIKLGAIEKELDFNQLKDWAKELTELILAKTKADKKIFFGLSLYTTAALGVNSFKLGLEIKKYLIQAGRKVRFVTSKESVLSSVVVQTNKLVSENGLEIALVANERSVWVGVTAAVQPFAELSKRDYGRPARDPLSGMLPPKLAKMLINLAEAKPEEVILDPFCGSGTILTEAWLMGYQNLSGSDNDEQAIKNTRENIDWWAHEAKLAPPKIQLKRCNARQLAKCWEKKSVNAIVTEPWLGPPLTGRESPAKINQLMGELEELYLSTFKQFKEVLKAGGKVVIIVPAFRQKNGWLFLNIGEKIKSLGFQQAGEPLFYAREDQRVGRRIFRAHLKK